jgi:3-dehydroquinate synthase
MTKMNDAVCEVRTATESYPIFAGWGLLGELGKKMRRAGLAGRANIISDETAFSIYGARAARAVEEAGFAVASLSLPPGEPSKTIESAIRAYDWLAKQRVERDDVIVALGGGVVGDLAGFVAATMLRGLPLVQVPTSLVAMVDASIGGKVAVNHPQGKNVIGAFYQPRLVLADVETLTTLPRRELISGWAEVIKHGLTLDPQFTQFLEGHAEQLISLEPEDVTRAVARSATIKAQVVIEDEKERGRRIILNYGHTIAHGLETATHYQRFLHGEAIAIGMTGAALISRRLGLIPEKLVEQQRALLHRFGLPTACSDVDVEAVLRAMELDKKVRGQAVRWVLLTGLGEVLIRHDVPPEMARKVIEELIAA